MADDTNDHREVQHAKTEERHTSDLVPTSDKQECAETQEMPVATSMRVNRSALNPG
jgi:hypothetical protein